LDGFVVLATSGNANAATTSSDATNSSTPKDALVTTASPADSLA
jgi:hypothetical protein